MKLLLVLGLFISSSFVTKASYNFKKEVTSENKKVAIKLAADKNFQEYNSMNMRFAKSIFESNTLKLFQKIANKTASEMEIEVFIKAIGYESKGELTTFFKKQAFLRSELQKNYPQLISDENNKEIIDLAIKKMDKKHLLSSKNKKFFPEYICWNIFTAASLSCTIAYGDDPEQYALCMSIVLENLFSCELVSD